jgi:hypothetical protein
MSFTTDASEATRVPMDAMRRTARIAGVPLPVPVPAPEPATGTSMR